MKKERTSRRVLFWDVTAVSCFAGAFMAGITGSLLTTSWILNGQLHPWLRGLGIILLMSAIPIFILGGHCLDLGERKEASDDHNRAEENRRKPLHIVALIGSISILLAPATVRSQQLNPSSSTNVASPSVPPTVKIFSKSESEAVLLERITQLEKRLAILEAQLKIAPDIVEKESNGTLVNESQMRSIPKSAIVRTPNSNDDQDNSTDQILEFLRDTTFNVTLDGYYGYNFNRPVGGINLLRAYDVSSNSFSLNQAAIVVDNSPNLEKGKRYGLRLDLQYGQATETLQGNAANEPRPQVYRPVWQAYGTYIFDVGKGLTIDFGKFGSALGYETNYTKDNFNYSRSLFFNFLPFYHVGFRSTYPFNDRVTVTHWLVNGAQQTEDFNGFKSQALLLIWKPTSRITSQFNYYNGQEQRDRNPALNPTFATVASQPGLSLDVIRPVPSGRSHVLDTYHTFNVTNKLTLAVEGDYVVGRVFRDSAPATVWGGVGYARYQWTPKFAVAGRFEYLSERVSTAGALFSGLSQALKEHTITAEYKFADGFLGRVEYRRDFSNQPFFLTEQPGVFKKEQNTATLGLVWWFGRKKGSW